MATNLGKPNFQTPAAAPREEQQAFDKIRERFTTLEAEVTRLTSIIESSKQFKDIALMQQQIAALARQVKAANQNETVAAIEALLLAGNGFVVVRDGKFVLRVLKPGTNITITYPDGYTGDPIINANGVPDPLPLAGSSSDAWPDWSPDTGSDLGGLLS